MELDGRGGKGDFGFGDRGATDDRCDAAETWFARSE